MKAILNTIPDAYKSRDPDCAPDRSIVMQEARELEIMTARMLREGKFKGRRKAGSRPYRVGQAVCACTGEPARAMQAAEPTPIRSL